MDAYAKINTHIYIYKYIYTCINKLVYLFYIYNYIYMCDIFPKCWHVCTAWLPVKMSFKIDQLQNGAQTC